MRRGARPVARCRPGAKVRSYPVHEKNNVVWIWMGDAAKADTAKIPDMPWLSDPKWATTPGNLYVKTNYQFIIDNLLDLTHVTYVHKNTLAGDPREATTPTKTERLNDGVRVGRWMLDFVPPPLFAKAGNFTEQCRPLAARHLASAGHRLSRRRLRQGRHRRAAGRPQPGHFDLVEPPDHARDRALQPLHVLLRPRLQRRRSRKCRSCCTRDRRPRSWRTRIFSKRCRRNRTGGSLDGLIHITADAAQLQARRMLNAMIGAEQA